MLRNILVACLLMSIAVLTYAQDSRHFQFQYAFTVKNLPADAKVRVWIPVARSGAFQDVTIVSARGDLHMMRTHEQTYGNQMLYAEASSVGQSELGFNIEYDVVRRERRGLAENDPHALKTNLTSQERQRDLGPNILMPTSGLPAELAAMITRGKTDPLQKARAIYDYVFSTMRYDKSGTGWGRGDVLYACSAKKGNCTDFHSLFISMARSEGIPARFEIGFPLPSDKHSAEIAGYHCWSDFYTDGRGWIPVDISEAWLNPNKRDYFFGSLDVNRIEFTLGRDLRLNPPQAGKPLNYFIYPYVEVNGQKYSNVSLDFSFRDIDSNRAQTK